MSGFESVPPSERPVLPLGGGQPAPGQPRSEALLTSYDGGEPPVVDKSLRQPDRILEAPEPAVPNLEPPEQLDVPIKQNNRVARAVAAIGNLTRKRETSEEEIVGLLAGVQEATAHVPGAVGRLANIVDALRLEPPKDALVEGHMSDVHKRAGLFQKMTYLSAGGTRINIERNTSFDHHPKYARVPPDYDQIMVVVEAPEQSTEEPQQEVAPPSIADLRKVGMRVRPAGDRAGWILHGAHQQGDWDGHPGTEFDWQLIDEEAANAFLDQVFGQRPPDELPPTQA